jgi:hypothetical protein
VMVVRRVTSVRLRFLRPLGRQVLRRLNRRDYQGLRDHQHRLNLADLQHHRRHRMSHYHRRLRGRRSQIRSRHPRLSHHPQLSRHRHFISRASSADQCEIAQRYLNARPLDNLWAGQGRFRV